MSLRAPEAGNEIYYADFQSFEDGHARARSNKNVGNARGSL